MSSNRRKKNKGGQSKTNSLKGRPRPSRTAAARRKTPIFIGVILLAIVAAALLLKPINSRPEANKPVFPEVNLAEFEPVIIESIMAAKNRVTTQPASSDAWGELAQIYWVYGLTEASKVCFERARELSPEDGDLSYLHSLVFLPGDIQGCLSILTNAVSQLPAEKIAPRLRLAQLLSGQAEYDRAKTHFETVLQNDPTNAVAMLGLGRIANAHGDYGAASQWLEKCQKSPYTALAANRTLSNIYMRQGDTEAAQRATLLAEQTEADQDWPDPYLEKAGRLKTGKKAWLDSAEHHFKQRNLGESIRMVRQILETYPTESKGHLFMGRIQMAQREFVEATESFQTAIKHDAENVEAMVQLGVALFYQQLSPEAENVLKRAIAISPTLPEAHYNLGLSQAAQNKSVAASTSFKKAIQYRPNFGEAFIGLASSLAKQGQLLEAKNAVEQALTLNPNDSRATPIRDFIDQRIKATTNNNSEK